MMKLMLHIVTSCLPSHDSCLRGKLVPCSRFYTTWPYVQVFNKWSSDFGDVLVSLCPSDVLRTFPASTGSATAMQTSHLVSRASATSFVQRAKTNKESECFPVVPERKL